MKKAHFRLNISTEKYLRHYQGTAKYVVARTADGRTVQFPANLLRQFITKDGIHGEFLLCFDEQNKVSDFQKVCD